VSETIPLLVHAARHNDEDAWDQLFRMHQLRIFTYALGFTRNRAAAFDIVQESFARAVTHVAGLRDDSRFTQWLFGIAHQRCIQHFRGAKRENALFDEAADIDGEPDPGNPDPFLALVTSEEARSLQALIEQLPAPQRSALLLHVLGEFSLEEIAEVSDVPVGTVKSRLHNAKRAMRAMISKEAL
jgi:RNA polymerase sigma-70 factor (ECF subfamily)